jgi:hypothetical protein
MNALRHWELRDCVFRSCSNFKRTGGSTKSMGKVSSAFEKDDTSAVYPYGAMNCIPALATYFRIAKSYTRWCRIFQVISEEGG